MKKTIIALLILLLTASPVVAVSKYATVYNPDTGYRKVVKVGDPNAFKGGFILENKIGATVPSVVAAFQTSLASKLTSSETSTMTLVSGTTGDGTTLNGTYGFTLDEGTSNKEYILATCVDTACTSLVRGISVNTGTSSVAALKKEHRRGASVKITDYPLLAIITNILTGGDSLPSGIKFGSDGFITGLATTTPTDLSSAITLYQLQQATSTGGVNASETAKGVGEIATQAEAAAGTSAGSTGARLLLPASMATTTPSATTLIPITNTSGKLSSNFIDQTANYTWSGSSSMATTTFTIFPSTPNSYPTASTSVANKGYVDASRDSFLDSYKNTQSAVASQGDTATTTVYSFCSSSGLQANDILNLKTNLATTQNGGSSYWNITLGNGTASSSILNYTAGAVGNAQAYNIDIYNRASTSSQYIGGQRIDGSTLATIGTTALIDLSSNYCLSFNYRNLGQGAQGNITQEYMSVILTRP
jgi:hypothetical protein